jgi:predicted RNA-binding Zn ribbon-like protein
MNASPHVVEHDHVIDLDGALDFLNTLDLDDGQLLEHFESPSDAANWFVQHGLLHDDEAHGWSEPDLERVRDARAGLRAVVDAIAESRTPPTAAVQRVNEILDGRPMSRLVLEDGAVRVGHRHRGPASAEALVPIAEAIVDEIAEGRPDRFRICDNDRCRWTFFDASPTGRRRWCDMKTCGNRAKAARHRARVKAAEQTG